MSDRDELLDLVALVEAELSRSTLFPDELKAAIVERARAMRVRRLQRRKVRGTKETPNST